MSNTSFVETYFAKIHISEQPTSGDEVTRKDYVDTKVSTAIANLVDSSPQALNTLKEIADALNNDSNLAVTLTNQINSEAAARTLEDGHLSSRINSANSQISKANSDITSEVQNRISAVNTETARATAKEAELQGLIDAEVVAREIAVSQVQSSLDSSVDTLTASISSETDSRVYAISEVRGELQSAVNTLNSSISDDNSRALSAESALDAGISNVNNALNLSVGILNTNISGEYSRAFDAENALDAAKLDKSASYSKDANGHFKVASAAYLVIGDRWRISCNSGDSEQRRLVFEYKTIIGDDSSWSVGVPFIQSQ